MTDDLISRQAAIDAVEVLHGGCITDDVKNFVRYQLLSVPSEPRWIPVTERLPEPVAPSQRREWFITSNTYGGVTVTCYEFEASPFKEGWQTDMTILAWMPLPEPYKE